ncbi:MAG TPA: DUF711 family protein [Ktedonobacteraceae bacterium]|jgi:uncharacterized protein (UPF0210 family)|nr:DUF711 family protein [Ktedonobacteraceae bacterium]
MRKPPIRTLTLGLAEPHPLAFSAIERAAHILQQASQRYIDAGYEVQTLRISTRPVFDDLANASASDLVRYAQEVQRMLDDVGLEFCSCGTAKAASPQFSLERIESIADMLEATTALNATVLLATGKDGIRYEAARHAARVMQRLARETAEGFGNFRFAVLARVDPGCPFFPSAYHSGPASLSIGLQGAGIVADALRPHTSGGAHPLDLEQVRQWIANALVEQAASIVELGKGLAQKHNLVFGGIDLSPAPLGEESIVSAMELCGYGKVGETGTVAVASAITGALKSTSLPTCGYCGLMLPVLEDAVLGHRWEEGLVNTHSLLLYSTVCGTGLDTIPLPGDIEESAIAHLLLDVATMALRLNKPLSARLFPVPGKRPGERTTFTSPYLTNTLVR